MLSFPTMIRDEVEDHVRRIYPGKRVAVTLCGYCGITVSTTVIGALAHGERPLDLLVEPSACSGCMTERVPFTKLGLVASFARDMAHGRAVDHFTRPTVQMKRIGDVAVPAPSYAHPGDAGMDLAAVIRPGQQVWRGTRATSGEVEDGRLLLWPGERAAIPCGWAMAIPPGFEGQVRPRSSTSLKLGLRVPVGTVDSGYRGEVCVVVVNMTQWTVPIRTGDRLAQIVIAPVSTATVDVVEELDETTRGEGGFGSTGGAR